GWRDLNGGW
uniref:Neuropeptide Grb-AST B2 n=1 Tax=Gryllus bimaculatus TaxID=6999 RepID=Q7M3N8_GRYBI|nr:juvenile hormone inhibitory neuropeptide grb-AST:SUBUNIT=B2 [Gryllus bimaculatus]